MNDCKIPAFCALSQLRDYRLVAGAKQLRKTLLKGQARFVILAENADPALTEPIEALCRENHVSCTWIPDKNDLGRACGIDVGAAAAAAVR